MAEKKKSESKTKAGGDSDRTGREGADEALAVALAAGATIADAAAQAAVSVATAYRRLAMPGFKERVRELRSELVASAVGRLSSHMASAADKLAKLMDDPNTSVALGACKAVLQTGFAAIAQEELARRIEELEQRLASAAKDGEAKL